MAERSRPPLSRRSFFTSLSGLAGATAAAGAAGVAAQSPSRSPFQPTIHAQDDWYESLPGKHRLFIDTLSPSGAGQGITFASNFLAGSRSGYELAEADAAIVVCLRHHATPFAWTDAVWKKYGEPIARNIEFDDPKTSRPPTVNVYNTSGYGDALLNRNVALEALAKRGVHFAVCALATRANATRIARATGAGVDDVFKELVASMIPNAHLVAAGVVAVNRAQERGYTLLYVG